MNSEPTEQRTSAMTGRFCTSCGAALLEGAKHCTACGAMVNTAASYGDAELATVARRFVALAIDFVIGIAVILALSGVLSADEGTRFGLATVYWAVYFTVCFGLGKTLGSALLAIRIVRVSTGKRPGFGVGFGRYVVSGISGLCLGLGFFWAIWNSRRQTWHDWACDTVVIRDRDASNAVIRLPPE